jgi:drug/metabolite transporter (DMT)-like permease
MGMRLLYRRRRAKSIAARTSMYPRPAVGLPDLVLILANAVYSTSYVASRLVLDEVPPATLALIRLAAGAMILVLACRGRLALRSHPSPADRWRIAGMGVIGFAGAFVLFHWGIVRSTATNAALLIIVEPVSVMLLAPLLLGERLSPREAAGAALGLVGALLVVVNGVPGFGGMLVPHWRGDALLIVAGVAYGSYSLLGRDVLRRHDPLRVTAQSILWGALAMVPLAALEAPVTIRWSLGLLAGVGYLSVVITALGYLVWNWALARVSAPRAAISLSVQPVLGALLGIAFLGEPFTAFIAVGGALIVAGLVVTVRRPAGSGRQESLP